MTFTYKSKTVNNYYIEMYQEKFESVYHVAVYPVIDSNNSLCGYPVSNLVYKTEKQAFNRFNNAIRYYSKV